MIDFAKHIVSISKDDSLFASYFWWREFYQARHCDHGITCHSSSFIDVSKFPSIPPFPNCLNISSRNAKNCLYKYAPEYLPYRHNNVPGLLSALLSAPQAAWRDQGDDWHQDLVDREGLQYNQADILMTWCREHCYLTNQGPGGIRDFLGNVEIYEYSYLILLYITIIWILRHCFPNTWEDFLDLIIHVSIELHVTLQLWSSS